MSKFQFVQHVSGTSERKDSPPEPCTLPQHNLKCRDKVGIQVHDEAGYQKLVCEEQEFPGTISSVDESSICVTVEKAALTDYDELPGKYFSIQTPACQLKVCY